MTMDVEVEKIRKLAEKDVNFVYAVNAIMHFWLAKMELDDIAKFIDEKEYDRVTMSLENFSKLLGSTLKYIGKMDNIKYVKLTLKSLLRLLDLENGGEQ